MPVSATTHVQVSTVRDELNNGDLNTTANALAKIKIGDVLSKIKVTFAALASVAAQNITTAAALAAATVNKGIVLQDGEPLPAIGHVVSLRVTAGGTAGPYIVTDAGGAAVVTTATYPGTALLSDDGTTITFAAAVTGFVLEYYPVPFGGTDQTFQQGQP